MKQALALLFLLTGPITFSQTITDVDGNTYSTITIGDQDWMTENLVTTHFADGTPISHVISNQTWTNLISSSGMCYPLNDSVNTAQPFGGLYNFWTVVDPAGLCPAGWRVPTDSDWNKMAILLDSTVDTTFVGATGTGTNIGDQLKEAGTMHWDLGNTGTNTSGFSARGAGYRRSDGTFSNHLTFAYLWTSSYAPQSKGWCRNIGFLDSGINRFVLDRLVGASVRCMTDNLSTGAVENDADGMIEVFPNPTNGHVTIQLPTGKLQQVSVLDLQGKEVMAVELSGSIAVVDMERLASGSYLLVVTSDQGTTQSILERH